MKAQEKLKLIIETNKALKEKGEIVLHPMLVADAGRGKSTIVKQLFGKSVYYLDLQFVLREDLGGIPIVSNGKVQYSPPEWVSDEYEIIFFDEFDKSRREIQSVVLSILTNLKVLNHDLSRKSFVFAAQPDFLIYSDWSDDTFRALMTRFVFIPIYTDEVVQYLSNHGYTSIAEFFTKVKNEKEEKLSEFRLPADVINPRLLQYSVNFGRELLKDHDKDEVVDMVREIFWYLPDTALTYIIEDITSSMELTKDELIELLPALNPYEILSLLPQYQHDMSAKQFFTAFAKVYVSCSVDERLELLKQIEQVVRSTHVFTRSEIEEVAYFFLVAFIVASEYMNMNEEFLEFIEKEIYPTPEGEILKRDVKELKETIEMEEVHNEKQTA